MPAVRSTALFAGRSVGRLAAIAAATALAITLAGCGSSSSATKTPTPSASPSSVSSACVKSGSVSDSVKVTGDFNTTPNVTINAPLKLTTTQRTVVTAGTGAKVRAGGFAKLSYSIYNGTTGKTLATSGYGDGHTELFADDASQIITGLAKTINCSQSGTRAVGVAPASEAFGSTGNSSLGVAANQVVVFVIDVVDVVPTKASGQAQPAVAGLPTVVDASNGTPKVTIPSGYQPPATSQVATLIKGSGAVVATTDTVVIQYQGINLRTGKIFQQTWGGSAYKGAANGFVPGFINAVVGQTVGSQVLTVILPADGYGSAGQSSAGIQGTDTILFVVDILASQPAATG